MESFTASDSGRLGYCIDYFTDPLKAVRGEEEAIARVEPAREERYKWFASVA